MKRRELLKVSALLPAAIGAGGVSTAVAQVPDSTYLADLTQRTTHSLFGADGLVVPLPTTPAPSPFARGLDRTLVLGGGGEYYVAWYCGFFHGLLARGVDPGVAEMVVGTSAGAYAGSALTSGHFDRLRREFEFFGEFPKLFAKLAPVAAPNASQKRAQQINFGVKNGDPDSIRAIGHAALAADNRLNGNGIERLAWLLTGDSRTDWPVAKMFTTANDCFTGERLVVHQRVAKANGIPLAHAAAASSSLPGVMGPTLLGQRFCMDGGIARTWAHTDLVAGSKRALVITLTDGYEGSLLSGIPHDIHKEIAALEATGTKAMLIIAGTPPGVSLLDPGQIAPALKAGYDRAATEAPRIKAFWTLS